MVKEGKCKYFPCHKFEQKDNFDCSLCYCPIYPCFDEDLGEFYTSKDGKKKVWDCTKCYVIHDKNIVFLIKEYIKYIIKIFKGLK